MKIVQYRAAGETKCGLETDDGIYATGYADTLALIRDGDRGLERAASAAERGDPVSVERILAPITNPGKIFDTFCPTAHASSRRTSCPTGRRSAFSRM